MEGPVRLQQPLLSGQGFNNTVLLNSDYLSLLPLPSKAFQPALFDSLVGAFLLLLPPPKYSVSAGKFRAPIVKGASLCWGASSAVFFEASLLACPLNGANDPPALLGVIPERKLLASREAAFEPLINQSLL